MEDRINQIEKDLSNMAQTQSYMNTSLNKIANTLDKISDMYLETKLLQQKVEAMDHELRESFNRYDRRVTKIENIISRIIWIVLTPMLVGIVGMYMKG